MKNSGFVHSVKVPRLYKSAAVIARKVQENGESLNNLVFQSRDSRFQNIKGLYSLIAKTLEKYDVLEILLKKSKILKHKTQLDPWLARILISELLWGKRSVPGLSKPALAVTEYHSKFLEIIKEADVQKIKVEKPIYIRVNTLKLRVQDVIDQFVEEGWTLIPTPRKYKKYLDTIENLGYDNFIQDWDIPEVFAFPPKSDIAGHALHSDGSIIIQDKASCFVAHLLAPPPGSVVLDMCAAPGLKTSHCAAAMRNEGKIYAVEINKERYNLLCEQMTKLDCSCVETIHSDALKLESLKNGSVSFKDVEYIFVDVPCTGSGIVRRYDYGNKDSHLSERLKHLHGIQCLLLKYALKNFPSAKKVVYSTCSLYEEENESVVNDVLSSDINKFYEIWDLVSPTNKLIRCKNENYEFSNKCLRLKPERDMTNGFFVAVFQKKQDIHLGMDGVAESKSDNLNYENGSYEISLEKKSIVLNSFDNTLEAESSKCELAKNKKGSIKRKKKNQLVENNDSINYNLKCDSQVATDDTSNSNIIEYKKANKKSYIMSTSNPKPPVNDCNSKLDSSQEDETIYQPRCIRKKSRKKKVSYQSIASADESTYIVKGDSMSENIEKNNGCKVAIIDDDDPPTTSHLNTDDEIGKKKYDSVILEDFNDRVNEPLLRNLNTNILPPSVQTDSNDLDKLSIITESTVSNSIKFPEKLTNENNEEGSDCFKESSDGEKLSSSHSNEVNVNSHLETSNYKIKRGVVPSSIRVFQNRKFSATLRYPNREVNTLLKDKMHQLKGKMKILNVSQKKAMFYDFNQMFNIKPSKQH